MNLKNRIKKIEEIIIPVIKPKIINICFVSNVKNAPNGWKPTEEQKKACPNTKITNEPECNGMIIRYIDRECDKCKLKCYLK